ncbi:serine hydrolase [Streptomyces sp. p1417]|uniref:Serine hydrolase n=2 Tax=Streptomyces typhae TaxID=2681492 RepID=A0A6L6X4T3_9ACTN|nr:serine hydrolase domain-containing protein [Streptomyces typhae]MVO88756.1 serine hydrolase [Streptomyces typhae]
MAAGALVVPAASATTGPHQARTGSARADAVQEGLNALVRTDGVPAALAGVRERAGHTRTYTAGVGDLATGSAVPRDGQVRVGSNTKAFTAVAVLQLVGEGKVGLDTSVETYLPGLVHGKGIDGNRITVRRLLQHTSGLPDYVPYLDDDVRPYTPGDLVDIALRHEAVFAPGEDWQYSNTNYVLAGMIIEKVTRRPLGEELHRRVIERAGLRHTYFPAPGDVKIREAHPKGYYQESPGAPLRDGTELDPSWAWAAGQMISTNSDLNRFYTALLSGDLLPKAQLRQMRTTVPAEYFGPGARYGLGIVSRPLSCGGRYWGHGGSTTGYETRGGVRGDLRAAANIAVTTQPSDKRVMERVDGLVDGALCRRATRSH